jgi:flagellar biosynthesis GTPase FlhF
MDLHATGATNMSKVTWAALVAATVMFTGFGGGAFAQTTPAGDPAKQTSPAPAATPTQGAQDDKAKAADDRKAKRAEERKAKREEAKKERAAKREEAKKERAAKRQEAKKERTESRPNRRKLCGAEWREAREAGKIEKGMTWPKFWSACNTRLKEQAAKQKAN